jgi:hypothetical protein
VKKKKDQGKDTNTNDVIRVEIKINGKTFQVHEKLCNTVKDFDGFQKAVCKHVTALKLEDLARFRPIGV